MRRWRAVRGAIAVLAVALARRGGVRRRRPGRRRCSQISLSYAYVIKPDDSPPHARQDIHYTIQVVDSKTRQPIENGEGQLFAGSRSTTARPAADKTWDGFTYGPEVGTYHAKLNFVVAGQWAVAIRFRRDSLHPLERIDWMQDVLDERPSKTP